MRLQRRWGWSWSRPSWPRCTPPRPTWRRSRRRSSHRPHGEGWRLCGAVHGALGGVRRGWQAVVGFARQLQLEVVVAGRHAVELEALQLEPLVLSMPLLNVAGHAGSIASVRLE